MVGATQIQVLPTALISPIFIWVMAMVLSTLLIASLSRLESI